MYKTPIIIIGMHRSGTTLTARILQELGLFIGRDLDYNWEPKHFVKHNDWLLQQCGAAWDNPESIAWLLDNPDNIDLLVDYTRHRFNNLSVSGFTGILPFLKGETPIRGFSQPWGWKDPRNTFTLPLWKEVYPDAKIINIYRDGVSVAASLRNRRYKISEIKYRRCKAAGLYNFRKKRGGFFGRARCKTLEGGFTLWESYVKEASRHAENYRQETLSVKYEEFLAQPLATAKNLADFCGLAPSQELLERVCAKINPERSLAYRKDEELRQYFDVVRQNPTMTSLGYQ